MVKHGQPRRPPEMPNSYLRYDNTGYNRYMPQGVPTGQAMRVPELYRDPHMLAQSRSQPVRPPPPTPSRATRHSSRNSGKEKNRVHGGTTYRLNNPRQSSYRQSSYRQSSHNEGQSKLKEKQRNSKYRASSTKERERSSKEKVGSSRGRVNSSREKGSNSKRNSSHSKRNRTDGHSQRDRKPEEPKPWCHDQHHGGYASWAPSVPKKTPPTPAHDVRNGRRGSSQRKSREFWPYPSLMKKYPPLRRKQGQVFKTKRRRSADRSTRTPSPSAAHVPRVPTPKYLAYLRAHRKAASNPTPDYSADTSRVTLTRPLVPPKPPKRVGSTKRRNSRIPEERRKSSFLRSLTFGLLQTRAPTVDSDTSFMCMDAKKLTQMRGPWGRQ
ncbi:hypothetical protein F4821DRAFT_277547 [Hypoxylon rubiginosum]|uniref:Uncharacterized protein n=1 Tax=Hypoxylon rubiginosum TaxID=110542 RepID=A0ACC0D5F5_9PEZI|nr:hypothetical protein F4821DRAFT_277547 [Hypoxylon rubiginosum]